MMTGPGMLENQNSSVTTVAGMSTARITTVRNFDVRRPQGASGFCCCSSGRVVSSKVMVALIPASVLCGSR